MLPCTCEGQRKLLGVGSFLWPCESKVFELRTSRLVASPFIYQAILSAPWDIFRLFWKNDLYFINIAVASKHNTLNLDQFLNLAPRRFTYWERLLLQAGLCHYRSLSWELRGHEYGACEAPVRTIPRQTVSQKLSWLLSTVTGVSLLGTVWWIKAHARATARAIEAFLSPKSWNPMVIIF